MKGCQRGFTLLEALVAMAIFSFIGVAAYTLLASTGRLKESGDAGYEALAGVQLALRQLDEDFSQFAPRAIGGGSDDSPALDAAPEDAVVEFTRSGWRNPQGMPRSGLQRVAWALDDEGRLLRRYRRSIDDNDPEEQVERIYVSQVESFEIRYLDEKGKWFEEWPPESAVEARPQSSGATAPAGTAAIEPVPIAVEVRLSQLRIGELSRVIPLR